MTRSLVWLVVLLLVLAPSLAAAERPLSQPRIVPIDLPWWEQAPAVAAGDGFLVAWESKLLLVWSGPVRIRTYDGVAARQELPIVVGFGRAPQAVWNGSEYLVLYSPAVDRFGFPVQPGVLLSVRVDRDGNVIAGSQTTLKPQYGPGIVVALAFDGANVLAAVQSAGAYTLMRLDREGQLLEETPIDYEPAGIAPRPGGGFFVLRRPDGDAVAAGGDRFGVVDNTSEGLFAKILDSAGTELERLAISVTGGDARSIAWDGDEWVTTYRDGDDLCTARFAGAASLKTDCAREPLAYDAVIAASAAGTFRAWRTWRQIITDAGVASTTMSRAFEPAAAVDAKGLLAAWTETGGDFERIYLGGIANDGTPRLETPLSGEGSQRAPRLSTSGAQTLLVWTGSGRILAMRAGESFTSPVDLGAGSIGAAVAARDGEWLVAWPVAGEIVATRLTSNLNPSGLEHFGSAASQYGSAAAATRDGYVVAWIEQENDQIRIVAEPLNPSGQRVSGGIRVVENEGHVQSIGIGCAAEACLLAWSDYGDTVRGVLIRPDGTRAGPTRDLFRNAAVSQRIIIHAQDDGSFRVHQGPHIVTVSRAGEPAPRTNTWALHDVNVGDAVVWRGHTTLVYSKGERVFAYDIPPRLRSVRH